MEYCIITYKSESRVAKKKEGMELFDPAEQENEFTKIRHGKPAS